MLVVFAACVFVGAGSSAAWATEKVELTEFGRAEDAQQFGWEALPGAALSAASPGRVGRFALRIDPGPEPQKYMGIGLERDIDLTGARPRDKIVFFLKQNYGRDICINVHTVNGCVYRYAEVTSGQWTRVEVDLDLAKWEQAEPGRVSAWTKIHYLHIYSRGFDKAGEYMAIDGFSVLVSGKPTSILIGDMAKWDFPWQSPSAWYIGNGQAAWAVSKATGKVIGGWNARTKERYLVFAEGRYHLEDRKSLVTGVESEDRILASEFIEKEQRIELACSNPKTPDLVIRKRYWIDGNKLFGRVAFTTKSNDLKFITYNSQASFARDYRKGGYYMGGGDGGGPLMPAPNISTWQKVTQYQNTAKGMVLHQPDKGYSFAHIRTRLDDRFVWPWFTGAIASYCEPINVLHHTPDGWDMSLGTSRLSRKDETSYEQYLSIFGGDWQTFLRNEYPSLPEVQQALKEIPPVPEWVGDIKIYTGADMHRLRRMVKMTDEGIIMVLFSLSGSWADYYVDRGMDGGLGGNITGPELKDLIRRIKALSPRIKVGIYQWVLSTVENTRIYKAHPEWFRYDNKDGEPLSTFPGLAPNYAHLLSIPECYSELLSQFDLVLDYLDVDYIYLDDPKAINMIDWRSGEYTRDDLSFKFFLDIKRIAAKHGPDKMVFFNNRGNPYGDVNFIEARSQLRASYWRHFVGIGAVVQEFVSATRPDARIIPLYYTPPLRREYMNRVLALGWIPSLTYCDVIGSRPFFQAAYELGNCIPVSARYSPDWKRDTTTQVESYAVQRRADNGYLLSFIHHGQQKTTVPVRIELDSLDLDRARCVFVWEYMVENALAYEGVLTEGLARKTYAETGWHLDRVTHRRLVYAGLCRKQLELQLDMTPLQLRQLYITAQPVAVYSENSLPANYLFGQMPKVRLSVKADWKNGSVNVQVDSERDQAEIIVFLPLRDHRLDRVCLDGRPVESDFACEGGCVLPVVTVGKGRHTLTMAFQAAVPEPITVRQLSASESPTGASINLPGFDKAILTVERNGRVLFNRVAAGKGSKLHLPLTPARPEAGEYTVSLRAVVDDQGRIRPANVISTPLELSAAMPDLDIGPDKPPIAPGKRDIRGVNRKIKGLEVLRSAVLTTATVPGEVQPKLQMLMAHVRPDDLTMEAGTSRKVGQGQDCFGAVFAGLEIRNLRKVRLRLTNTFHSAFHMRGPGFHVPPKPNSRNFAGIVVDYHTPRGYTKRVALFVGVRNQKCNSPYPDYGKSAPADEYRDLSKALIQKPEHTFALDLQSHAPADWDGQVWFSVGSDWIAPNRRLKLQILAANDDVSRL